MKFYIHFYNKFYFSFVAKNTIFEKRFFFSMHNDFNIVECFAVFFDLLYESQNIKKFSFYRYFSFIKLLKILGNSIGFFYLKFDVFLENNFFLSDSEINDLILERLTFKKNCEWDKADFIRYYLSNFGIILEDKKNYTIWKKV